MFINLPPESCLMAFNFRRKDRQKAIAAHVCYYCQQGITFRLPALFKPSACGANVYIRQGCRLLGRVPAELVFEVILNAPTKRQFMGISVLDLHASLPPYPVWKGGLA
ncbi:MAG: hypothetical protein GYB49_09390 [Alphaproteobacteria bacterium]|nr:hypothetical protein [Alphaproteobacteria bacterium]